jgi:hypothetical protein
MKKYVMISQCHWGEAVKNVLDSAISPAPSAKAEQAEQAEDEYPECGPPAPFDQVS